MITEKEEIEIKKEAKELADELWSLLSKKIKGALMRYNSYTSVLLICFSGMLVTASFPITKSGYPLVGFGISIIASIIAVVNLFILIFISYNNWRKKYEQKCNSSMYNKRG